MIMSIERAFGLFFYVAKLEYNLIGKNFNKCELFARVLHLMHVKLGRVNYSVSAERRKNVELISFFNNRKTVASNLALAKQGDKEAFLSLLDENKLNIYRVAKGMLREEKDIEDAIQNTIIKAYSNIKTLKQDEYFKTWLVKVMINECNTILRSNKKTVAIDSVMENEPDVDNFKDFDLTSSVYSLSEDLRVVTVLFYFEDMSQKDIAKFLDIPEGTVKSRLTRARKKLYEVLGEE